MLMNRKLAYRLQAIGCVLIVTVMMTDHFLFELQEGFVLSMAVLSALILASGILMLKWLDYREDVVRAEAISQLEKRKK